MASKKLSEEELFQGLKSLNVPVRLSDINIPTKDFVIRVLDCFLRDQQIDISSQSARSFNAIKHMDNPDMFQDGQMLVQLVSLINKITSVGGFTITIRDIVEPKPKRTKRLLNYLIVFWNYSLQKNAIFQNVELSLMEERKQVEDMQDEISILERKKEEGSAFLHNMEPSKEELQSCVSSKLEKTKELEKQHKAVTEENEMIKKREKDIGEKISTLDVNILSVRQQISDVEGKILSSPDRMNRELQLVKDSIKNAEIKVREMQLDLKAKRKTLDTVNKTNELNQKSSGVLKEIRDSLEEFSKTIGLFVSCHHDLENEEEQLRKLMSELETKDKLKSIYVEKEMKISLNTKKQKESMEEALVSLKKKVANDLKGLELLKSKMVDIELVIDQVADSIIEIVNQHKQAEGLTEKEYSEYITQMESMHGSFLQDCKEVKEQVKKTFYG